MNEPHPIELLKFVEARIGCEGSIRRVERVREEFQGNSVWDGNVYVFDVRHPATNTCYAWWMLDENEKLRAATVLGVEPIKSAVDAVRAAIVAESRANKPG